MSIRTHACPEHAVRCVRCGGFGKLEQFTHVDNGRCYRCGGTGEDPAPKWATRKWAEFARHDEWARRQDAQELARRAGVDLPETATQGRVQYTTQPRSNKRVQAWLASQWKRTDAPLEALS